MKKYLLLFKIFLFYAFIQAQNNEPILILNTEMHTARINRIDTDAAGKYIVTCSNDKTAKLWSTETGKLLQTFRPPIGLGDEGLLYAAAIDPDGKYVAVGGWSANYPKDGTHDIYIFNSYSGILIDRIAGLGNVIGDLEFSKDGQFLAAALGGQGIRVYETSDWTLIKKDTAYKSKSCSLAFSSDGSLATVSFDGYIRLYNNDFELLKKEKTTGGSKPFSLAFSPDGQLLALGYVYNTTLQVLNAKTLKVLFEPETTEVNSSNDAFSIVTFSEDKEQLIAGGSYRKIHQDKWWHFIRVWDNNGFGSYRDFPVGYNIIKDIKKIANGKIVFGGTQPDWGIWDMDTGVKKVYKSAELNDYRNNDLSHFKINKNGSEIGFTPKYEKPLSFDLNTRMLKEKIVDFQSYQASLGEIEVSNWEDSYAPKLNERVLTFLKYKQRCKSVDIADNARKIIFGAYYGIYAFDNKGKKLWETPTQSTVSAVNIAANVKVVVACLSNGKICWYRMSDGALLLTLFVHPDRHRWILWTPSGYYDASAGAEDLIGWHVNQGPDTEALYYPISKFRDTYYRPDVIDRILQMLDESKALKFADGALQKITATTRNLSEELPPIVRILSPITGTAISTNTIELEYSIKSPNKEEITAVKILIDGRPLENDRGIKPLGNRVTQLVTVPSKNCTVSVIAENRFGSSPESSIDLIWKGQRLDLSFKPNLYLLVIGVSDYDNYGPDNDLKYADDDATAFANTMKQQEGVLYNKVVTKLYTEQEANKDNILDGLDWLVNETTQRDVAMLFFAGHGIEDNRGTFYYLPVEADENFKRKTCIMEAQIQETVSVISGKIVVFMDACHSGSLMKTGRRRGHPDVTRIVNELISAENGAVVFSSSTGRQYSLEDEKWGHGAFTKALVEGLEGAADVNNEGKITCKSLDLYITRRVKDLTNKQQTPTTNYPPNVPDFPISIINGK